MMDKLYEVKSQILDRIHSDIRENGAERINIAEMDKLVDMVKDLSESEKACWEADYYRTVTEAMERSAGYSDMRQSGYTPVSYDARRMYPERNSWEPPYGYSRRGYQSGDYRGHLDALRMEMQNADPKEREQIVHELANMGMM